MDKGICTLSIVPVRAEADDRSEMVSQIIFGETYTVHKMNGKWCQVKLDHDHYEGWISLNQHTVINSKVYEKLVESRLFLAYEISCQTVLNGHKQTIVMGSTLPHFDGMTYQLGKKKAIYNGQVLEPAVEKNQHHLMKIAHRYLNVPYLWGGRSPFGIDCSGFTQIVFKFIGIDLKRDTYQQAQQGRTVNMITESREGDLAFFENEAGKIMHVGIMVDSENIIHASGKVRIDRIDNYGIFNAELEKYTHKLKVIKRLL